MPKARRTLGQFWTIWWVFRFPVLHLRIQRQALCDTEIRSALYIHSTRSSVQALADLLMFANRSGRQNPRFAASLRVPWFCKDQ